MNRTWGMLKWLVVGASALALSACAGFVPPAGLSVQDVEINASASEVEFVGGVESMGANSWTVGGVPVGINAETQIDPGLAVGDLAKVHAMVAADTSLTGREIRAVESQASSSSVDGSSSADSSQAEMEFTGAVVSMEPSAWVVGDRTVTVSDATEIKDAIVVGDMVKVHAQPQPDGSLTAREIELAAPPDPALPDDDEDLPGEVHFFGTVEDIQADHWVVAGTTFLVTTETEIKDAIVIGDSVKVDATQSPDGSWVAHEIELEDEPQDEPDEDEADSTKFFGTVTAMDTGSWIVGGLTFLVTPSTEIKDAIVVGDFVKIEALVGADGSYTALEIELEEDQFDDDDGEDDSDDEQEDEDEDEDESGEDESGDDDSENSGSGGSGGDD